MLAAELGPTLDGLRPFARELAPALRKTQPFLRETTPIIRDQIRPFARDVQPMVRDLRRASKDLAVVTPRLTTSVKVLNKFFNAFAYDPPGAADSFLFWSGWGAHAGATLFNLQDAHGPVRRGLVAHLLLGLRDARVRGRGQPAARHDHAPSELPARVGRLPAEHTGRPGPMIKQAPSFGRILAMVAFALSCFGILIFLWLSFGGSVPLRPEGYRVTVAFPEATQLAQEADVRISGVRVGRVKKKEANPESGLTDAEIEIDARYAPIPKDTRAILRQKTLLGETYVELSPGTRGGGTRPRRRPAAGRPGGGDGPARRDPAHLRPRHAARSSPPGSTNPARRRSGTPRP